MPSIALPPPSVPRRPGPGASSEGPSRRGGARRLLLAAASTGRWRRSPSGWSGSSTSRATGPSPTRCSPAPSAPPTRAGSRGPSSSAGSAWARSATSTSRSSSATSSASSRALPPQRLPPGRRSTRSSGASHENVYITFRIKEGRPDPGDHARHHRAWTRCRERRRRETLVDLPLQQGDPFNRFVMQATADTITRRLATAAIPSARVFTSFETNKRRADGAGHASRSRPGKRAVIGDVERGRGPSGSRPSWSGSCWSRARAGCYSQDELFQSQRNLYASDLFRFATVNIDSAKYQPSGRLGAAAGAGERGASAAGSAAASGYGTDDCFRGSLGLDHAQLPGSGGRILDLTSRISKVGVGRAVRLGTGRTASAAPRARTRSAPPTSTSAWAPPSGGRRSSRPNNTIAVSLFTERRSEFKVYLRQETGTTVTLPPRDARAALPALAGLHALLRPHRGHAGELLRARSTPARRTWSRCCGRTGCSRPSPATGDASRGSTTRSIHRADRWRRAEVTWSSRFLGSSSFQQFIRARGRLLLVPPASPATWCSAGGSAAG